VTTDPETVPDPSTPWYRRPANLLVLALFVLAAGVGIGLIVSADDDDGTDIDTTDTTDTAPATTAAPPTTTAPPPPTTAVTTTVPIEDQCVGGDQEACDQLPDDRLDELCDDGHGSLDACQVLLARQGDGVPDGDEGDPED
jgi:hypothetical protein